MRYRKIHTYMACCLAAGFAWTGCNKDFLEVAPQGQLTEVEALRDPAAADKVVAGAYNTLYLGDFGNTTVGFQYFVALDVASDDADKGSTTDDYAPLGEFDNFTLTPNNAIANNLWRGYYEGIARCNQAIDILNAGTLEAGVKNRLLGESRFLRGMYYFNMVRLFGGVPRLTRVPQPSEGNNDEFQTRASAAEIYNVVKEDLEFAANNLPLRGDATTQVGRANKGAAQAFLAKVYLYEKNYARVISLTDSVIASGRYSLVNNYNYIFRERAVGGQGGNNNTESIFEVNTGVNAGENAVSNKFSNSQGPRGRGGWNDLGFGFNDPTTDLAGAYEAGDTRRNATIIFINPTVAGASVGTVLWDGFRIPTQDSVQNPRYNYKAYHSPTSESAQSSNNKDTKPKNIRLMRYAEVLLMNAEAAANTGDAGKAKTSLDAVRTRAGLASVAPTVANIWNERRVELAMEGDRFLDLVRQGRAGTVMRAAGKPFVDGKHNLLPIPQAQRDLSGGRLLQNPNY